MEAPAAGTEQTIACNKRILIADDEEAITALFKEILQKEFPDSSVDLARDGEECIEQFSEGHHKAILMDLHMPKKDGLSAFQELRTICREKSWEIPSVLFFTGFAPPDTIRNIVAADQRHDVLMKPIALDTLLAAVRKRVMS